MTNKGVDLEQVAPQDTESAMLVCEECGAEYEGEQIKCPQCGMVVDEIEESLIHWGDEIVYPEDMCNA